ncbi:MAG: ATP-binding protein [Bacillaceae bacterium]|nr:ATP-binding protein [Bacillaceae bacterium]
MVEEPILKIIDHETGEMIGDPAITTAILGRIIHRAEIIQFDGSSYRMKHRTSIFKGETVQN